MSTKSNSPNIELISIPNNSCVSNQKSSNQIEQTKFDIDSHNQAIIEMISKRHHLNIVLGAKREKHILNVGDIDLCITIDDTSVNSETEESLMTAKKPHVLYLDFNNPKDMIKLVLFMAK